MKVSYMMGKDFYTWTDILKEFYSSVSHLTSYREFEFVSKVKFVQFRVRQSISSGKYNTIEKFVKKFLEH